MPGAADAPAVKPEHLFNSKPKVFFLMDSLYNTLVSLLGGGLSGWIIASHQKRLDRRDEEERQKNANQIAELQEKRLSTLEKNVENHIASDNPEATRLEIQNLTGAINKLSDKLDLQNERRQAMEISMENRISKLESAVLESRAFTQNLYQSMQKLRDLTNDNKSNFSPPPRHSGGSV